MPPPDKVPVLYEDETLIAINKPSGLYSVPARQTQHFCALHLLEEKYAKLYAVHRLDKDTSGLLLFAKTPAAHRYMNTLFENRSLKKEYRGIVQNRIDDTHLTLNTPIAPHPQQSHKSIIHKNGKEALTKVCILERFLHYTYCAFFPLSGRMHQIRVHTAHIGHPIACDALYDNPYPILLSKLKPRYRLNRYQTETPLLNRLGLHAYRLDFIATDGQALSLTAPLPNDLSVTLKQLNKNDC